ncbi:MAG: rhodanese-like domain-containing protein [Desulfobacteraceae bacterium]|jgi:rhodanese-related sulfurtransferase|nr:MAG: rhodanese-like domain-containing protein [Desulfobacteraceae bacterium]
MEMKRLFVLGLCLFFLAGVTGFAAAAEKELTPLEAKEKEIWSKACASVPKDRQLNVEQFKKLYDDVVAGKEKAYLIDTRTHPEFYAFHIPYTDHVHAGHMYTIPSLIKDKDAKIVVFCRTHKRQCYVAEKLIAYGYTNVWAFNDGIVGWIKAGYPVCNQFTGLFKITEYSKEFKEMDKEGKPMYRIREFHPY